MERSRGPPQAVVARNTPTTLVCARRELADILDSCQARNEPPRARKNPVSKSQLGIQSTAGRANGLHMARGNRPGQP